MPGSIVRNTNVSLAGIFLAGSEQNAGLLLEHTVPKKKPAGVMLLGLCLHVMQCTRELLPYAAGAEGSVQTPLANVETPTAEKN